MPDSLIRLLFLSLLIFCRVSTSSLSALDHPIDDGLVACRRPHQIQALMKFKNEFDSRSCNEIDYFNGVLCDNKMGAIKKLHSICKRTFLDVLFLPYNKFTCLVPQCLSNMTIVSLRKNNLVGSTPYVFSVGASLRILDFGYNRLTGKLRRSLLNCSSLEFLSVDNNRIEDTFPFWLKALPSFQILTLRSNRSYGPISPPHQVPLGFRKLRIFEITDNEFTGSLLLTSYIAIDFSANKLAGQIPESIGLLKALIALNLSNNEFTGHIPFSIGNFAVLESFDISNNQLTGIIPNELNTLSFLEYVNVSNNQLKGEIPQGTQITGQPKSSFEGNVGLCGLPLKENCFMQPTIQQSNDAEEEDEQVLNWKAVAVGYGSGVLLGLAIAQVIASYKSEWLSKIVNLNKHRNR